MLALEGFILCRLIKALAFNVIKLQPRADFILENIIQRNFVG